MQTFFMYTSATVTLSRLDIPRLRKQRVEAKQMHDLLIGKTFNRWRFHAATRMWEGYENALAAYYNASLFWYAKRGGHNNLLKPIDLSCTPIIWPPWIHDPRVIMSHRASLLRKEYAYYKHFGWSEQYMDSPYYWPAGLRNASLDAQMREYWQNGPSTID
jgi:hypothetical protein